MEHLIECITSIYRQLWMKKVRLVSYSKCLSVCCSQSGRMLWHLNQFISLDVYMQFAKACLLFIFLKCHVFYEVLLSSGNCHKLCQGTSVKVLLKL